MSQTSTPATTLYHYTGDHHLRSILKEGTLRTTESNIGAPEQRGPQPHHVGDHVGPDVVWLTDDPDVSMKQAGKYGLNREKVSVRITVTVPSHEVHPWLAWSRAHGIPEWWAAGLERGRRPRRWWVIDREITKAEWTHVGSADPTQPTGALGLPWLTPFALAPDNSQAIDWRYSLHAALTEADHIFHVRGSDCRARK